MKPLFNDIEALIPLLDRGVAVLTPNLRLSRAVREAEHHWRRARGDGVWSSSVIMPLREYWKQQWNKAVTRGQLSPGVILDAQAQRVLWQRIIEADNEGFSLLSAGRAATLCQQAGERLALWQINLAQPAVRQEFDFGVDTQAFFHWHTQFLAELKQLHACTPEQAQQALLAKPELLTDTLALLEVEDLAPLHEQLCEACPDTVRLSLRTSRAHIKPTLAYADTQAELQAAARWCREKARADPDGRYAVVLSDMPAHRDRFEYLLRREFDCLTSDYESLPVNFSTGFALARVPLVRDALKLLRMAQESVEVEDVVSILQSRFVRPLAFATTRIEARIRSLRELMHTRLPQRLLRAQLDGLLEQQQDEAPWNRLLQVASQGRWHRRQRHPSEWLPAFRAILEAWGWSQGRALDSLEFQQLAQWQEAIDNFASLDALTGTLDFSAAVSLMSQRLADTQFQPRTPDSSIQVLGPLETTGLGFDGIWLTSMNSAYWPPSARPNPYLPHSLQREQRMPHVDSRWEWSRAQSRWQDWLVGATELQASYVNQADGAAVMASPLIAQVQETISEATYAVDQRWLQLANAASFDVVSAGSAPLLDDEKAAKGVGTQVVEQQSNCPFQAFAATRLRAAPASAISMGLSPGERGAMLHKALYDLFGLFNNSDVLHAADDEQRQAAISAAVDTADRALSKERLDILGAAPIALEQTRLRSLLHSWLVVEEGRGEFFEVAGRESPRELELGGLQLRLRIDRIDTLPSGQHLIIDYKSGMGDSIERWKEERSTRPQLPLYALLDADVSGIAYASLKPGQMGFRGVGERAFAAGIIPADQWSDLEAVDADPSKAGAQAMQALKVFWRAGLQTLAEEFRRGDSRVDPTRDACRYCQRFALCRLADDSE